MLDDSRSPTDDDPRAARIGRALDDYLRRKSTTNPITPDELIAAHPDLAGELREHLELLSEISPNTNLIADLIAQGTLERCDDQRYQAQLGPYKITDFLGRGGMGIVLKTHEQELDRTIALKILRPELAGQAATMTRFQREARAAAALQHPNIVTVHAVGSQRGVYYIAMEYVPGPSLADLIQANSATGHLTTETIRHIFRQLLTALEAAHAAGLIHRDVKPSNILLVDTARRAAGFSLRGAAMVEAEHAAQRTRSASVMTARAEARGSSIGEHVDRGTRILESSNPGILPTIKLADFGLARMQDSQTQLTLDNSVLGTPEYMSPEQARGDTNIDHRTDLYSAGVVLYEMLTGRTPFHADTPTATIHRILHDDANDPRKLEKTSDHVLAGIALRLIEKRPADRFESATDALAALDTDRPTRLLARQRRRWRFIAAGILAVAALACIMALTLGERTPIITEARIDEDTQQSVYVRYGTDLDWTRFPYFPHARHCPDAVVADIDGYGTQVVVAGTTVLHQGSSLFAVNTRGEPRWSRSLTLDHDWPDLASPKLWVCQAIATGNLDQQPGDELAVAARHRDHSPSHISIISSDTGVVRSTLWHNGHVIQTHVVPDHFEPGHPAVVAIASCDCAKLLPPPLSCPGHPIQRTNMACAMMVLDPWKMQPSHLSTPADVPFNPPPGLNAYAFLDMPYSDLTGATPGESAAVVRIAVSSENENGRAQTRFTLYLVRGTETGGALLTLDQNLGMIHTRTASNETIGNYRSYWQQRWRPIVQDGLYLGN